MNDDIYRKIGLLVFTSLTIAVITTYGYHNLSQKPRTNEADEKFKEVMRMLNDPNATQRERDEALAEYEKFMDSL